MTAPTIKRTMLLNPAELNLYPGNARQGDVGAIVQSLERLGQYRSVVVNEGTLTGRPWEVLAGNHTVMGARQLRWESISCEIVDVDEATARRIVLVDNRTNDLASYDDSALLALLDELDGDYLGTGFDGDDHDDLRLLLAAPPSIDDLAERHGGEPRDDDSWILVLGFKVPPPIFDLWRDRLNLYDGDPAKTLAALLA